MKNIYMINTNVFVNYADIISKYAVVGVESVVTKDIPPGVIAVGNPCKVMRKITEEDKLNLKEDFVIL